MTTYEISYSNGETRQVASEKEAREILNEQYPDATYNENGWESLNPDGSSERLLVWEDEEDSLGRDGFGDGGELAVAEIIRRHEDED